MQHETQLRSALTRALMQEQGVMETDIALTIKAEDETVTAQIKDQQAHFSYQEALEKAFLWAVRETRPEADGYYPVAHLHREDILSQCGRTVASQLSEEEIELMAQDMWNDAFSETYWLSLDWLMEDRHSDLMASPQVKMEQRLKDAIARFRIYDFGNLEDAPLLGFLKGLIQAEASGQTLTALDLAERFLKLLQTEDAFPIYSSYEELAQTLELMRYEATILTLMNQAVQDELPLTVRLQGVAPTLTGLHREIKEHFEAGDPPEAVLEDLLKTLVERVETRRAEQRAFEEKLRQNHKVDTRHELQDPESKGWLMVQIRGTASGLALDFPQLQSKTAAGEPAEVILGVDYYNEDVHALINNAEYPNEPQMVYLGRLASDTDLDETA